MIKLTRDMWIVMLMWVVPLSINAATIEVEADRNPVGLDESLQLIFKTTDKPDGDPDFSPLNTYLDIHNQQQSNNISYINGSNESIKTWTLTVFPKKRGKLTLPAISFGKDRSPPYELMVKSGVVRKGEQSIFFSSIELDRSKLYTQQQLVVTQRILSATNLSSLEFGKLKFSGVDVITEPLGDVKQYTKKVGQDPFLVFEKRYAVYPVGIGTLKLDAVVSSAQQSMTRSSFFLPFGSIPKMLRARSRARQIKILPKPMTADMKLWLPATKLALYEEWDQNPPVFVVGEPVTRTLTLKVEGVSAVQLPDITGLSFDGIKQYPDQPLDNDIRNDGGIIGHRVQKVVFIPTREGKFELPAIEIPWWNIEAGTRELASLPARTIEVIPAIGRDNFAPGTDTAKALAKSSEQSSTAASELLSMTGLLSLTLNSTPWFLVSILLTFGWLMTVLLWYFKSSKRITIERTRTAVNRSVELKQAFDALAYACRKGDVASCRNSVLDWARIQFDHSGVTTLQDATARAPDTLAQELKKIDAVLYGASRETINFKAIRAGAKKAMKMKASPKQQDVLEPLYKSSLP